MYNYLVISYLKVLKIIIKGCVKAPLLLCMSMQNRVVLQCQKEALKPCKHLIIRLLNSIYVFVDVINCEYLCIAKVPYYGRFEDRHSTYDNANAVRDAAGSRGIICTW